MAAWGHEFYFRVLKLLSTLEDKIRIPARPSNILYIPQSEKFMKREELLQLFVDLFCFVGEQIGFKVLVFGPAGSHIESGRCNFLTILDF